MARKKKLPDEPVVEDAAEQATKAEDVMENAAAAEAAPETEAAAEEPPVSDENADDEATGDEEDFSPSDDNADAGPTDDVADQETRSDTPIPPTIVTKKTGFFPTLLGGVLCAGLGYGAAQYIKPEGWPFPGANTADTSAQIAALEEKLASLQDALSAQEGAISAVQETVAGELDERLSALDLSDQIGPLSDQIEEIGTRMTALEARPVAEAVLSDEAAQAYESQFEEMRSTISDEVARLTAAQTEAKTATAIAALRERIDLGEPFGAVLADLEGDVPEALLELADTGVPSLAELQERFPTAAREAVVVASRDAYEAGEQGFVQNFLFTQLGMRSTQPKDGDGADAVLSRAEQALRNGKVGEAVTTLDSLPDGAKAKMADWAQAASNRVTALDALSELIAQ